MEHLTCFIAGNLALGVENGAVTGKKAVQYLGVAKNVTRTCYEMYRSMPSGSFLASLAHQPQHLPLMEGLTWLPDYAS
jgi:hypothetical protein